MLRRIFTPLLALLLFALAFSIRHRTTNLAALILPHAAIAQATASAPAQTVSDQPELAQADTGPGSVDTVPTSARSAAVDDNGGLSPITWGVLLLIVLACGIAWYVTRKRKGNELVGYGDGDSGGVARRSEVKERTRGGP